MTKIKSIKALYTRVHFSKSKMLFEILKIDFSGFDSTLAEIKIFLPVSLLFSQVIYEYSFHFQIKLEMLYVQIYEQNLTNFIMYAYDAKQSMIFWKKLQL